MSKNKGRVEGAGTVTVKEKRSNYGRRSTDLTPDDIELIGEFEKVIHECTLELENAHERMELNQEQFDRLKSESRIMQADTEQIIATFEIA